MVVAARCGAQVARGIPAPVEICPRGEPSQPRLNSISDISWPDMGQVQVGGGSGNIDGVRPSIPGLGLAVLVLRNLAGIALI